MNNRTEQIPRGFRAGISCLIYLRAFFEDVSSNVLRGKPVGVVCLDVPLALVKEFTQQA